MEQAVSWFKKYRPKTFAEYAGDFADAAVKRFSDPTRRPQVVLLHGNYGCGKTTAARLLAGYYLCDTLQKDGTPCGKCAGCLQVLDLIENGEDDAANEAVQEINASSVNRIEDIRRLITDSMLTLPVFSRYKVFILDECHRITPEAQNALLKVLEDVPAHLVVIFATTDVEKILSTVVSRCQLVVEVRRQTVKGMVGILENIAMKEALVYEKNALHLIAKKGGRVPRDCISLLEDIASVYDGQVTTVNVLARTGEVDTSVYLKFIEAAHKGLSEILTFVSDFSQGDVSYQKFLSGLSRFVLNAVYLKMAISTEEFDKKYSEDIKVLFKRYKADELHKLLRIVDDAARRTASELGSVELALTVMALRIGDIAEIKQSVSADEAKVAAAREDSSGAKKFVEREKNQTAEKITQRMTLEDILSSRGAVEYKD